MQTMQVILDAIAKYNLALVGTLFYLGWKAKTSFDAALEKLGDGLAAQVAQHMDTVGDRIIISVLSGKAPTPRTTRANGAAD